MNTFSRLTLSKRSCSCRRYGVSSNKPVTIYKKSTVSEQLGVLFNGLIVLEKTELKQT